MRARKADAVLEWPKLPEGTEPDRIIGHDLVMSSQEELARGLVMPVQLYPMFETALRAAAGESVEAHQVRVSELWAGFSAVAAGNPYAWIQEPKSAAEIRTPGPSNRMIGLPYPKYMNSNNDVDQAAALLMCSAGRARSLGVPEDRWVFPHSGADCHEHPFVSNRWSFSETPAVRAGGRAALDLAGVGIDDIELVDLYSCFPSAVQLGAASLGLNGDRQLTAHRRAVLRRWSLEQLRHARHRHRRGRAARAPRRARPGVGQRGVRHQALVRRVRHPTAGERLPSRRAAGRGRRRPAAGARSTGRRRRSCRDRGLHRDARSGGPA